MTTRFTSDRDILLFDSISRELVGELDASKDGIINQSVIVYKVSPYETESNIYGESPDGKRYKPGVQITCLISADDFDYQTDERGPDRKQIVSFSFLRNTLVKLNFVVEIGDVIEWNTAYFEITSINENQLVGGRYDQNWAAVCNTVLMRRSKLNVEQIRSK